MRKPEILLIINFYIPLISVMNSSCLIFPPARSIFRASSNVNVFLSASYSPRTAYLNTSNVMYSMMLLIRFCVIGDFMDLWRIENEVYCNAVNVFLFAGGKFG